LACYESATFNTETCVWDVTGTQPVKPTLACYESATFNTTTCDWVITGTQPTPVAIPSTACNTSSDTVDLNTLLPAETPANGIWIDVNNSGHLQSNILSPLDMTSGDYVFEYKFTDGNCPLSILINMNVDPKYCIVEGCGNIKVHNAFTPNGDDINEKFVIDNIEQDCHLPNTVEIYNRWGVLVFETKNYNNDTNAFEGVSKGRSTISQSSGLPTGTYYYILNYDSVDGNGKIHTIKEDGFLYLSK
jgi:gliding motility-associated-like protein